MFNIIGFYKIKQEGITLHESNNLITLLGESYFMNRCISDTLNPMKYIVLGNGETIPLKSDENLSNKKYQRICTRKVDLTNKRIVLTASFNSDEIVGITEIGVANDEFLISHDTFKEITSDLLVNPIGSVEVEYSFQFNTGTIRKNWVKVTNTDNVYRLYEPSIVTGIFEKDTGTGYQKVGNKDVVSTTKYSYYHDTPTNNLYVQCNTNESPLTMDLIIQTK